MGRTNSVNLEILRKYDRPGPRYTSYPTAPMFSPDFGPSQYKEEIVRTNRLNPSSDISIYVHLPFCDSLCYFCGCTSIVTRNRKRVQKYCSRLKSEIAMVAELVSKQRKVAQLHWGGGTPSHLTPEEILDLGNHLRKTFEYTDDIEASVEIDPRGLTREHMEAFREVGFNRVSIGVQDFDPRVQEAVNRIQPEALTLEVLRWVRRLGFSGFNVDLIYGLPLQTADSFAKSVDSIINMMPDRIAVFNYAHVPRIKPHQKIIRESDLPKPDMKLQIFKMTFEKLVAAGYWNIGLDHFAKMNDELAIAQQNKTLQRNFQGYSTKAGCDLYGFGMSAIGQFRETYHQNAKRLPTYYEALDGATLPTKAGYRMTRDDHIRREVIMRLMCDMEIDKRSIELKFGIEFDHYLEGSLRELGSFVDDGLISLSEEKITVNGMGRIVVRNIAMCFDAYLDRLIKEKPIFSRTV